MMITCLKHGALFALNNESSLTHLPSRGLL